MAFCNSCGATLDAGTKFCNKCGAAVPVAAAPVDSTAPVAAAGPPKQGSSALKIILIVVAVIVGLGVIGTAAVGFMAYKFAKSAKSHIEQIEKKDGGVKVDTPFGTVESSSDASAAARDIGVDVYPGASAVKGASATMDVAGMHTVTTQFQTSDPASDVAEFYKSKLSNITYSANQGDSYTMMAGDRSDMTTITIQGEDGKTVIQISKVTKK